MPALASCAILNHMQQACTAIRFVVWTALSALRVYAVSGGNRLLTSAVVAMSVWPAGTVFYSTFITTWRQTQESAIVDPHPACFVTTYIAGSVLDILTITARVGATLSDFLVVLIIWSHTHRMRAYARRHNVDVPLASTLCRDVGIYRKNNAAAVTYFRNPLTAIVLSHFLFNLRDVMHDHSSENSSGSQVPSWIRSELGANTDHRTSGVLFASFVANMGEDLIHDLDIDRVEERWPNSESCVEGRDLRGHSTNVPVGVQRELVKRELVKNLSEECWVREIKYFSGTCCSGASDFQWSSMYKTTFCDGRLWLQKMIVLDESG
ncbi:hypothetical protein OBBRIDRAFT_795182 [Obba rivulosa]|uniref:Uncharacterized protein n=1 Tax=Obba rivulosa TaxID=1052685 RepID=A0A8E2DK45_9APHY|nr:hypothetical protein OBBRIDRAFT_795182 [Obba rivulosa]